VRFGSIVALAASASASACTVGAAGRMELAYHFHGAPDVRASAQGGVGITAIAMPDTASRQTVTVVLMSVGGGWGTDGPFLVAALEGTVIPPPGEGSTGIVVQERIYIRPSSAEWSLGVGGARLVEQTHAEDTVDQFGANPRLTRVYQDAIAFIGVDFNDPRATIGVAYDVGIAKLLFAPGP
jgi:hypothetical protein